MEAPAAEGGGEVVELALLRVVMTAPVLLLQAKAIVLR